MCVPSVGPYIFIPVYGRALVTPLPLCLIISPPSYLTRRDGTLREESFEHLPLTALDVHLQNVHPLVAEVLHDGGQLLGRHRAQAAVVHAQAHAVKVAVAHHISDLFGLLCRQRRVERVQRAGGARQDFLLKRGLARRPDAVHDAAGLLK